MLLDFIGKGGFLLGTLYLISVVLFLKAGYNLVS